MSDIALDTNILLYRHNRPYDVQRTIVDKFLDETPVISSQVISEYLNVMQRRFKVEKRKLIRACAIWLQDCYVHPVTDSTIELADTLINRYDFQLFDGIIVASALEFGCGILYSEDMHDGLIVEKKLTIVNPFK
ncbi:hypothetical protein R80B4_00896 [Fibrobacteres bacterium R8-0-B4]